MTNTDAPGDGLAPCPFCGGEAEIIHIDEGENAGGSCVCCKKCMASSNVEFEFKENFVSNWNRRAPSFSVVGQEPVAVRPLEWFGSDQWGWWQADAPFGRWYYIVSEPDSQPPIVFRADWMQGPEQRFNSFEEARAAAQADYEQRILSALEHHS